MPTIGQLPNANSVSDTDEIPIFQNGQTVSATRAQLLAGFQQALALPQGSLLGGIGPGTGAPVPIAIGANLTLAGSTISATAAPFEIAGLAAGIAPGATDLVAIGQSGGNVAIPYASFMQALGMLEGVPGSNLDVRATGASATRTLAAVAANAVSIEDFGAKGDGVTDDSAALLAALASGNPVRFGPKLYIIDGECDISGSSATLIGVPGETILMRGAQSHAGTSAIPAWISVTALVFNAEGIIFDANRSIIEDSWGVVIQSSCGSASVRQCLFRNAMGAVHGWGLAIAPNDPAVTQHRIHDCEFTANAVDGVWIAATDAVSITACRAHDNTRNGIYIDSQDPSFTLKIREVHVLGNTCWNNQVGIVVGNFNATNLEPAIYGNANPDVLGALIIGNNLHDNTNYGLSLSGRNICATGNLIVNNSTANNGGGGILANTGYCRVSGNMVVGASDFGIDAGGSIYLDLSDNYVNGALVGLNVGGSQNCMVRNNFVQDCSGSAIVAINVESDGRGNNFGISCSALSIIGNWISYGAGAQGIVLRDAPQAVLIADNVVSAESGADPLAALLPYTDSITMRNNILNGATSWLSNPMAGGGGSALVFPDLVDAVTITQASAPVSSMMSAAASKASGQVTFIKVTNAGSNYTTATVNIVGAGMGASATALIAGGQIIGVSVTSGGSGYGAGTTAFIIGDGSGATASVQIGLPVVQNRSLAIYCTTAVQFETAGSSPAQINWTGAPITVPAGASIDWRGYQGAWQAVRFSQSNYLSPNGDGSVTFRSQSGDIMLHPSGTGALRLISDAEPTGCVSIIGRGSPTGVVNAPPGSTFRNLNGGAGMTFWVKQTGTGNTGWAAVA